MAITSDGLRTNGQQPETSSDKHSVSPRIIGDVDRRLAGTDATDVSGGLVGGGTGAGLASGGQMRDKAGSDLTDLTTERDHAVRRYVVEDLGL